MNVILFYQNIFILKYPNMSLLLLVLLFITDTTGATPQVLAKNIDLESNTKDPGKIYKHFIKNILLPYVQYTFHLFSVDKVNY